MTASVIQLSVYGSLLVLAILPVASATQQCLNEDCGDGKKGTGSLREFSYLESDFEYGWLNSN